MYNEALMVRKVKSYLSSISVTTDEEALQRLSLEIEPPQVTKSFAFLFIIIRRNKMIDHRLILTNLFPMLLNKPQQLTYSRYLHTVLYIGTVPVLTYAGTVPYPVPWHLFCPKFFCIIVQ